MNAQNLLRKLLKEYRKAVGKRYGFASSANQVYSMYRRSGSKDIITNRISLKINQSNRNR